MNIQHSNTNYFPEQKKPTTADDFVFISNPDGTCHSWLCSNPGVVLVYDVFCPEVGIRFCEECWQDFCAVPNYVLVMDKRERQGEP